MKKLLALTILFFLGNWLLDVGNVVYSIGIKSFYETGVYREPLLGNGFWNFPAIAGWHFGWYVAIASFIALAFLYIKEKETKANKAK